MKILKQRKLLSGQRAMLYLILLSLALVILSYVKLSSNNAVYRQKQQESLMRLQENPLFVAKTKGLDTKQAQYLMVELSTRGFVGLPRHDILRFRDLMQSLLKVARPSYCASFFLRTDDSMDQNIGRLDDSDIDAFFRLIEKSVVLGLQGNLPKKVTDKQFMSAFKRFVNTLPPEIGQPFSVYLQKSENGNISESESCQLAKWLFQELPNIDEPTQLTIIKYTFSGRADG